MSQIDRMDNKQNNLRTLLIAMIIVPSIVIFIRFWSRALLPISPTSKVARKFWWDDWTALIAAVFNVAVCGIGLKLVSLGMGKHIQLVDSENFEPFFKLLWIEYFIFDTGTAVAKSSALFFYARIFGSVNCWFKWSLWAIHFMNVGWLVGILSGVTFMCNPIQKAWKVHLPGTCLNTGILWLGSGISSLLIDILILLLPLPMLWRLQLRLTRKLQIIVVFICGYLVVVVSIGRLVTIAQAGTSLNIDPTYKISTPVLWLGSEIAISVISVSLPSLLFIAQRAYRDGAWSLISTRPRGSTSKLISGRGYSVNSQIPSQDGDETELSPPGEGDNGLSTGTESHVSVSRTASPVRWDSDRRTEAMTQSRIHVRSDVFVS